MISICKATDIAHDHLMRSRGVDIGAFLHNIRGGPSIIDDDVRCPSNPDGQESIAILLAPFLELDPWHLLELQEVPNHGQWERARRQLPAKVQHLQVAEADHCKENEDHQLEHTYSRDSHNEMRT